MSGDIQTRKRKDKKRRKEDEGTPFQPTIPLITNNHSSTDDVNIHVHKEGGLGGGICAKLVFFVLLSALAVLIGLIITEHRGLTDVDVVDTNSKFSQIFEGWTDSNSDHHEDDHDEIEDILSEEHEDHDEEDKLEADTSEPEDEHEDHDGDEDADQDDEVDQDASIDEDDDGKDEDDEENEGGTDDSAENEDIDDEIPQSQEQNSVEQNRDPDETNESDEESEVDEDDDDDDDIQQTYDTEEGSEEEDQKSVEKEEEPENDQDELENEEVDLERDDDDDVDEEDDNENDDVKYHEEEKEESGEENISDREDRLNDSDENADEEDSSKERQKEYDSQNVDKAENIRKIRSGEEFSEEQINDADDDEDNKELPDDTDEPGEDEKPEILSAKRDPDEDVQESSGMAVKVGVGVALLVVAHLVLCRKWRSASDDKPNSAEDTKESTPDLSRRNTIIVPPTFQEVEQDIEHDEEDLSEEEELSDQEEIEARTVKERYAELRSTYSNTLSPEGESLVEPLSYEDDNEYEEDEEEISEEEEDEEEDDIEDDEENDEECDDDESEELMKRLEAKYGKLSATDSGIKRAGIGAASVNTIRTNTDHLNRNQEIDDAHDAINHNPAYAVKLFDKILEKSPSSSRSIYGKALALNHLADQKRSNEILYRAIRLYAELLKMSNVPDALYEEAAERTIKVMRFVGDYRNIIEIHKLIINRFPEKPKFHNELAVTYLTINRIPEARRVLTQVLKKWPNDGFALVHQGFILKTADNKFKEAVEYLSRGIATNDTGVVDGRFYFHLGDALERLGQHDEAMKVYEEGTRSKVFLSKYQRSLYNVQRLKGKAFWEENEIPYLDLFKDLKQNWRKIREEGLSALNTKGYFQDESENLRDTGEWKQFELFARGQKNTRNCAKSPITCSLIERNPEAKLCKRGQTKFSVMHPGTHVWPHCGPTNCRLRVHLGLKVPPKTFLRVADEIRSWNEGKLLIFDDSFEHEVWHNGTEYRLVLIVDVWHPELTASEKKNLSPI